MVSLAGGWLIRCALRYLIEPDSRWWKQCVLFFSCWILNTTIIYVGDVVNILAALPCFLLAVFLCCRGSLWKKATLGMMYSCTLFSFNAIRDNFLHSLVEYLLNHTRLSGHLPRTDLYMGHGKSPADILLLHRGNPSAAFLLLGNTTPLHTQFLQVFNAFSSLLFAILLYAGIRKFAPDRDYTLPDRLWRLLLLLTATPFGIVLSIVLFFDDSSADALFSLTGSLKYVILLAFTLLAFVSLLWCICVLARQQKLEQQSMLAETNRKYYESMKQQHFEIRRLKHDLANHLQTLAALSEEQRDSYLQNLSRLPAALEPLSYCGDATVNAVLSVKKAAMDRCGISPEISADIPGELPFDKVDICALYANALDNAMEACMKLDASARVVNVKSRARKGLFCLEVSNPVPLDIRTTEIRTDQCSGAPPAHNSKRHGDSPIPKLSLFPSTTKKDKANHGFGLKGMEEIVSRYHGHMELSTRDGIFELFLYLPLDPDILS